MSTCHLFCRVPRISLFWGSGEGHHRGCLAVQSQALGQHSGNGGLAASDQAAEADNDRLFRFIIHVQSSIHTKGHPALGKSLHHHHVDLDQSRLQPA